MNSDEVADAVGDAVRTSASVLQAAANSVAQFAASHDPLAALTADDYEDDLLADEPDYGHSFTEPLVPVPLSALTPWSLASDDTDFDPAFSWHHPAASSSAPPPLTSSPFPFDPDLNGKVYLFEGDADRLSVEGLIAPAAAGLVCGASTILPLLLRRGGPDMRDEISQVETCRSGEARIAKAYNLACRWLLLTVGPKYKDKYKIAAQNTLNSCHRESFQLCVESKLRTLALPCAWYKKGYPLEDHAHVSLRTVRRCLEHLRGHFDAIVFVTGGDPAAGELYRNLLPLYFPRSEAEAEASVAFLPEGSDSAWGDVSVEERKITLSGHTVGRPEGSDDDEGERGRGLLFSAGDEDDIGFLNARSDADDHAMKRLECTMVEAETPELQRQICLRYFRRARELRSENDDARWAYRAYGEDRYGRKVIVILGARFPSLGVRDVRTLPLFIKEVELLQGARFVLLYVNSGVANVDSQHLEVLHELLTAVGALYRGTLDQLLLLHPGIILRAAFALGRVLSGAAADVWHNSVYLDYLEDLVPYVPLEQLQLPPWVNEDNF